MKNEKLKYLKIIKLRNVKITKEDKNNGNKKNWQRILCRSVFR